MRLSASFQLGLTTSHHLPTNPTHPGSPRSSRFLISLHSPYLRLFGIRLAYLIHKHLYLFVLIYHSLVEIKIYLPNSRLLFTPHTYFS